MRICPLIILCVAVLAAAAYAKSEDNLGTPLTEASVALFSKHTGIRIVREDITAQLGVDQHHQVHVRANYAFKNEDEPATVQIGFIDTYDRFKMSVDGKPVKPSHRKRLSKLPGEIIPRGQELYHTWNVVGIEFGAGQVHSVVTEYDSDLYRAGDSPYMFDYGLGADGDWKRPIGEVAVCIDTSSFTPYLVVEVEPKGFVGQGSRLVWTKRNVNTHSGILVSLYESFGSTMNGKRIDYDPALPYYDFINGILMVETAVLRESGVVKLVWTKDDSVCTIHANLRTLRLTQGSKIAILNGKTRITLPAPAFPESMENSIPMEAVMKALGGSLSPDKAAKTMRFVLPVSDKSK